VKASKVGVWLGALTVASADHLGGGFFGLMAVVLILRAWVRSRPPMTPEPVQPSQDDALAASARRSVPPDPGGPAGRGEGLWRRPSTSRRGGSGRSGLSCFRSS
jgi:hypothetical protein